MKQHLQFIFLLFFLSFIQLEAQVEVSDYGDIPSDRIAANGWAHFDWDGSGEWTTIDVTQHGIVPNTSTDIAPLVTAIINGGSGKRILKFPEGTFQVKSGMNITKSDIQIVGEGSSTRFMLAGGANPGSIFGNGSRSGNYKLFTDAARGDNTATLTSASAFNVGDYFIIYQAGSVTRPDASGDETQIFKIVAKSGNTLTLDMKFGIPFKKDYAYIEKLNYKKNLRFHNFYMEMTTKPTNGKSTNLSLNTVQNVEVSNIESKNALTGHITIFRGRECIVHDNYVYGNYGGGGGFQYGYTFNFSTNCQMIHNRTANLRHHYVTQFGTDHCVIAYNRAEPTYNDYADFGQHNSKGCHNNLWEGNYGSEIYDDANPLKSWGTRYTMWFRNHATSKIGSENEYVEHMNIIGNELKTGTSGIKTGAPGEDTFAGANIVNVNTEGATGTMVWGNMSAEDRIPASLFLAEKPAYLSKWPLYGPPASYHPKSELEILLIHPDTNYITIEPEYTLSIDAQVSDEKLLDSLSLYINEKWVSTIQNVPFIWHLTSHSQTNDNSTLNQGLNTLKLLAIDSLGCATTLVFTIEVKEKQSPFFGVPINIPGIIEAENYDKGGEGVSYHDFDEENRFGFYRSDRVDIDQLTDGGYFVSYIYQNEWLNYTIDVEKDGYYKFGFVYSCRRSGGKLGAEIVGSDTLLFSGLRVPTTRSITDYQTLTVDSIYLAEGTHILRIDFEREGYNLDKISIDKAIGTASTSEIFKEILLYPNPTKGIVHISKIADYKLFDISGILLFEGEADKIDLSNLKNGLYLVSLNGKHYKIIKD